jgi:hypothetical protein
MLARAGICAFTPGAGVTIVAVGIGLAAALNQDVFAGPVITTHVIGAGDAVVAVTIGVAASTGAVEGTRGILGAATPDDTAR